LNVATNDSFRAAAEAGNSLLAVWLNRALTCCLFLMAAAAPHSIAATQTAWLLALVCWVAKLLVRPRAVIHRTPLDYVLLGFFILTFISALMSYDADVSIGKLRAASLFTIVYIVTENIRERRVLHLLTLVLVASCMLNVVYTFGVFAVGRGVKVTTLATNSPLFAAGVLGGDTLLSVDGSSVHTPEDVERAITIEGTTVADKIYRGPGGSTQCVWDEQAACVRVYRTEALLTFRLARNELLQGSSAADRLGIAGWSRGRDERAAGFYGHYTTYAETLQLIASLALGLFVSLPRKVSINGVLLGTVLAGMCGALILTLTRASWLGLLLSGFTIALVGAGRRTLIIFAAISLPLIVIGLLVLQQKRQVGFIDPREGSTAWRLTIWGEGVSVLTSNPRHLLVGVGMDSLKRHWREWGMFDHGRLPSGHLHSTPLQIAFERGLPALAVWLTLLFIYGRMLWRLSRRRLIEEWTEQGLVLGALGGLIGFAVSGFVHYNLGDSEVAMILYLVMGLALTTERLNRKPVEAQPATGLPGR
jgi:O-antigen ligase